VHNSKLNYTKCSGMHRGWGDTPASHPPPNWNSEEKKKDCVDAVISNSLRNLHQLKLTTEIGRC